MARRGSRSPPCGAGHENVITSLVHSNFGCIMLDVLQDNKVGGVEFYDRLFKRHKERKR